MDEELRLKEMQKAWHGSFTKYLVGFIACLIMTTASFFLVATQPASDGIILYSIAGLALFQAIFQLTYFLHLGKEDKPHWESWNFYFMLLVLVVIVAGSLWIMNDLNQRMMI